MKHKYLIVIIVCFTGFFLNGCNKLEHKNAVPTYIHLDSFAFRPTSSEQGTSSHYINSVFVFYNNSPVGVFDLPCTFPVITNDSFGTLEVEPAIPQDGLNDYELYYPFYTIDTFSFASSPGNIINHTPVTGYFSGMNFIYNQTFDDNTGFTPSISNVGQFSVLNGSYPTVFEGAGCGVMSPTNGGDSAEFIMVQYLTIPISSATFLELNYRSNADLAIGMVTLLGGYPTNPFYLGGLKPSGSWQKVYFNLSQYMSDVPSDVNEYYLTFKVLLPPGQATGQVYLDNLKIVSTPY